MNPLTQIVISSDENAAFLFLMEYILAGDGSRLNFKMISSDLETVIKEYEINHSYGNEVPDVRMATSTTDSDDSLNSFIICSHNNAPDTDGSGYVMFD